MTVVIHCIIVCPHVTLWGCIILVGLGLVRRSNRFGGFFAEFGAVKTSAPPVWARCILGKSLEFLGADRGGGGRRDGRVCARARD